MLEIVDLCKTYDSGERALSQVSLVAGKNEIIAILGLSGSGKSTLLRCINRLVEPTSGTVTLDGDDITSMSKRQLRHKRTGIGMIFQSVNLVDRLSVLENVLTGTLGSLPVWRALTKQFPRMDVERALDLCERVGIIEHAQKRADQLSGGQRQRVGIARTLMQSPSIILADEPTSSLDPKISYEVMELIRTLSVERSLPMLVALHDIGIARKFSDRIVGMKFGVKVFDQPSGSVTQCDFDQIYVHDEEMQAEAAAPKQRWSRS
jgi:phosphonate transport system ATP-binding protein